MFVAIAAAIFSHVNLICYFQKLTLYFIIWCLYNNRFSSFISQFLAYYIIIDKYSNLLIHTLYMYLIFQSMYLIFHPQEEFITNNSYRKSPCMVWFLQHY